MDKVFAVGGPSGWTQHYVNEQVAVHSARCPSARLGNRTGWRMGSPGHGGASASLDEGTFEEGPKGGEVSRCTCL